MKPTTIQEISKNIGRLVQYVYWYPQLGPLAKTEVYRITAVRVASNGDPRYIVEPTSFKRGYGESMDPMNADFVN